MHGRHPISNWQAQWRRINEKKAKREEQRNVEVA